MLYWRMLSSPGLSSNPPDANEYDIPRGDCRSSPRKVGRQQVTTILRRKRRLKQRGSGIGAERRRSGFPRIRGISRHLRLASNVTLPSDWAKLQSGSDDRRRDGPVSRRACVQRLDNSRWIAVPRCRRLRRSRRGCGRTRQCALSLEKLTL